MRKKDKLMTSKMAKWFMILVFILASISLSMPPETAFAAAPTESWVARYNGPASRIDRAVAVAVDTAGNVYVTGVSEGALDNQDYATIKYGPGGNQLWVARYNGPGNSYDAASALAIDATGNVYVTGTSHGGVTATDYATIKYDANGNQLWVARYNGPPGNGPDSSNAVAVDTAGNVYVTGYSYGGVTQIDYATIKYNNSGVQQWVARYNGAGTVTDYAVAVAVDESGNVYVTGRSEGPGTSYDYATIKYNSSGAEQWVARYNGPASGLDWVVGIDVDGTGNVYVTGYSEGAGTGFDYATIKYNSSGVQQWLARYNGPVSNVDMAGALAVDGSGNVYVTGGSLGSGTNLDSATIKYDSDGNQLWVARYNGPVNSDDRADALAPDGSGNVYITGFSWNGTSYNYATIKYNGSGVEQWVALYNGPANSDDQAMAMGVDGSGNVYITGYSYGSGAMTDYATIKYAQNTPPVAVNDSYSTNEDTALNVAAPSVLGNDTDADGNALTATLVSGPAHGTLTLNADGSFTYTPNANFNGSDSFSYKANDGVADSDVATVTITVNPVNDPPVLNPIGNKTVNEGQLLTFVISGSDPDGDPLTYSASNLPAGAAFDPVSRTFSWTPSYTQSGSYPGVQFQVSDGSATASEDITITVSNVNRVPVAVDDVYTTNEDIPLNVATPGVLANDTDADGDALTAILVGGPAHGTLTLNADGSFTYTPNANFNGSDSFSYKANDGVADSDVATVTITVNAVNDPPVAANDAYSTNEDAALNVAATGVLGNDTDADGNALTATLVSGPAHGSLTLNANGSFTYTPAANYSGPDSFTYKANDGTADSNVATATITVNPVNDPPVAGQITATAEPVKVGDPISVSASFTDPDIGDTHTAVWDWGDGATASGAVSESNGSGSVTGSHTYTAAGVYTVTLTVTDPAGASDSSMFYYVVAYNPEGGFVTGGGWINSPPGAYRANPDLTGKANFGFVSKYRKGADIPTGNTEFQFKVANLNFHSDSYQWLVVAGARAQYKGIGAINGAGDFGFILTAIDGQISGGGGVDKFRIKIWEKATDQVVYDNQPGDDDTANLTTVTGGGSIVIHKGS